jgi:hypothetical protein
VASQIKPPPVIESLLTHERDSILAKLQRDHARTLQDNREGCALIATALDAALLVGLQAQCEHDGLDPHDLQAPASSWEAWQQLREEGSQALGWPPDLVRRAPAAVEQASELLATAAAELDLRARERRSLATAGGQSAEAGAALVRALTWPAPTEAPAFSAETVPVGQPEPDGSVGVALAANQAECELIQGRLEAAGIPSTWRRTGGDLPLLSAGYREIYVPMIAAGEAQALLATVEPTGGKPQPEPRTRTVGLERTGIRLLGKATAALMLLSYALGAIIFLPASAAAGAIVALLLLIAAIVAWSERASIRQQRNR